MYDLPITTLQPILQRQGSSFYNKKEYKIDIENITDYSFLFNICISIVIVICIKVFF